MKVSIIITCYNRERFISRAIRCAISQRFERRDFEVIVVDDASTDHSREIIADFGDEIVALYHDKNRGLPAARNTGIRRARGRFVVHLDSDDYMHDQLINLEHLFLFMNPEWGAVGCDYFIVDPNERHIKRGDAQIEPIACGVMFRKDNLVDIGLYDERMRLCEDEELRLRYQERYTIGHIALPLYRYTKHEANMTNDGAAVAKYRKRIGKKTAKAALAANTAKAAAAPTVAKTAKTAKRKA